MFMKSTRAYVAPDVEILDVTVEAGFAVSNETGANTNNFGTDSSYDQEGEWQ